MSTFTIVTEETPAPEVTQATEQIFIQGLPVLFKEKDSEPIEATYNYGYEYGNSHNIILPNDQQRVVNTRELTQVRPLTDAEMVVYLTEQLYEASKSAESYKKMYHSAADDLDTIATALSEEAESRGWCSEYNEFCNQVNATLKGGGYLQPFEQEYEVEVEIEATIRVPRTIYVMASSYDDAVSMVTDDPETYLDPSDTALEVVKADGWDEIEVNVN